jgi:hypothetical protein
LLSGSRQITHEGFGAMTGQFHRWAWAGLFMSSLASAGSLGNVSTNLNEFTHQDVYEWNSTTAVYEHTHSRYEFHQSIQADGAFEELAASGPVIAELPAQPVTVQFMIRSPQAEIHWEYVVFNHKTQMAEPRRGTALLNLDSGYSWRQFEQGQTVQGGLDTSDDIGSAINHLTQLSDTYYQAILRPGLEALLPPDNQNFTRILAVPPIVIVNPAVLSFRLNQKQIVVKSHAEQIQISPIL